MTKKVIAIVSVLKPVDDTRNFEKIAISLGNTNKYEINIIGFSVKNLKPQPNIRFYPFFHFERSDPKRLLSSIQIFKKLLKLKPELIIVTCAELLAVICLYKIIFGCKIVYDIQENYYRNICYTNTYHALIRYPLALFSRLLEWYCSPMITKFLLAEKVYNDQLAFIRKKYEIIENKAIIPEELKILKANHRDSITFVYTGTIAEHYGIYQAIAFIKNVHKTNQNICFRIIGYAPDRRTMNKVSAIIRSLNYVKVIGGNELVPHHQVLKEISKADFCLLPYQLNRSTFGRIPTKLFECLAMEKPVIIQPNRTWNDIIKQNNAGIIHDFSSDNIPLQRFVTRSFYGKNMSNNYLWNTEETKLLKAIDQIF